LRCYACDEILIPDLTAFQEAPVLVDGKPHYDIGFDDHYGFDNALWIKLGGGYGMFVESDGFVGAPNTNKAVICHDCAHEACEKLPWLRRMIDPWASHSHKSAYVEAHPDHWGWDYSRWANPDLGPTERTPRPPEHEIPGA